MSKPLPAQPSLRQLQVQAKELAQGLKQGDTEALGRFREAMGRHAVGQAKLHDAQLAIAREYGFENWSKLRKEVLEREARVLEPLLMQLRTAIERGDVAAFENLMEAQPALRKRLNNPLFEFGSPAIRKAVNLKNLAMVDALLKAGADINQRSDWAPGSFGVLDGVDDTLAEHLIIRGAMVDIHAAAGLGKMDRLRQLLDANPELVNARGGDGGTPLHFAKNLEIVELLLGRGADVCIRDLDHGSTAAMWQVRNREILYRLIDAGSPVDIFMACVHGDLELAKRALSEDPDCLGYYVSHDRGDGRFAPDTGGNHYNWTIGHAARPIPVAAKYGHKELVRFLMERAKPVDSLIALCFIGDDAGVDEFLRVHPGILAEMDDVAARAVPEAINFRELAAVRRMVKAGFPLTGRSLSGGTSLHIAAWFGDAGVVRLLVERGASLEDRSIRMRSRPLEWACHGSIHRVPEGTEDYVGVVETLLGAGVDTTYLASLLRDGETDWAAPAVVAVLKDHLKPPKQ
jgi:ankyrin repeat protein